MKQEIIKALSESGWTKYDEDLFDKYFNGYTITVSFYVKKCIVDIEDIEAEDVLCCYIEDIDHLKALIYGLTRIKEL